MATPGDLVTAVAEALAIPEATVFQYDRELVRAGLRRTGGRGRSSIKVSANDAANLIISIVGGPAFGAQVKESAATLSKYIHLPAWADSVMLTPGAWERTMPQLTHSHGFGSALAEIIRSYADGSFDRATDVWPELKMVLTPEMAAEASYLVPAGKYDTGFIEVDVTLESPLAWATIEISGGISIPAPGRQSEKLKYFSIPNESVTVAAPVRQTREFSEDVLKKVATLFANEDRQEAERSHA